MPGMASQAACWSRFDFARVFWGEDRVDRGEDVLEGAAEGGLAALCCAVRP